MYKQYITFKKKESGNYSFPANDISKSKISEHFLLADIFFIQKKLKTLTGKILTLVDATISDKQQNKAFKDIVKKEFMEELTFITEIMNDGVKYGDFDNGGIPETISVDEILKD